MAAEVIVLFHPRGKCHGFVEIRFTFPDRMDEKCRQNGRRSDCLISSQGKVPRIRGKTVHFPLIEQTRNAGRRAVEAIALFHPRGKCHGFAAKRFTFPDRTDEECRQNGSRSDCPISSRGKVPLIRGNLVHFPPIGRTRNAGRMAAEAIVLFHPGGKCLGFMENWCTFPSKGQTFPLLQESEVPATGYL